MIAFAILCLIQNAVFTAVSRSRNSGDVRHHAKWALASNGIFFLMQIFLMGTIWTSIQTGTYWQIAVAFIVYTLSTAVGSVWMMARMLKTETGAKRVGAGAEPDKDAVWQSLARARMKIEAIKAHRATYGSTLKEAKDAVEAYQSKMGIA